MIPSRKELSVMFKSLLLFVIAFFTVLLFLKIAVALHNYEIAKILYLPRGGSIENTKLEVYYRAQEIAFYCSIGIAFLLSQSTIWLVPLLATERSSGKQAA